VSCLLRIYVFLIHRTLYPIWAIVSSRIDELCILCCEWPLLAISVSVCISSSIRSICCWFYWRIRENIWCSYSRQVSKDLFLSFTLHDVSGDIIHIFSVVDSFCVAFYPHLCSFILMFFPSMMQVSLYGKTTFPKNWKGCRYRISAWIWSIQGILMTSSVLLCSLWCYIFNCLKWYIWKKRYAWALQSYIICVITDCKRISSWRHSVSWY
jgi:hypothetical protein